MQILYRSAWAMQSIMHSYNFGPVSEHCCLRLPSAWYAPMCFLLRGIMHHRFQECLSMIQSRHHRTVLQNCLSHAIYYALVKLWSVVQLFVLGEFQNTAACVCQVPDVFPSERHYASQAPRMSSDDSVSSPQNSVAKRKLWKWIITEIVLFLHQIVLLQKIHPYIHTNWS